jgi:hypothetical protein
MSRVTPPKETVPIDSNAGEQTSQYAEEQRFRINRGRQGCLNNHEAEAGFAVTSRVAQRSRSSPFLANEKRLAEIRKLLF